MEQMVTLTIEEQAKQYPAGTTLYEIAQEYQPRYTDDIILAQYNDKLIELQKKVTEDGTLTFLTTADKNGRRAYRRSVVMLMQKALTELCPNQPVDILVDHSLGQGYYCRIRGEIAITPASRAEINLFFIINTSHTVLRRFVFTS